MQVRSFSQHQLVQALSQAHHAYSLGRLDEAKHLGWEILKQIPTQADAIHLLGIVELKDGNIDEAIAFLRRATKQSPKHPQFLCNYGLALHEAGLLKEAETCYRKVLSIDPRYGNAYYNLHGILLKSAPSDSVKCLESLLKLNPQDADARFMLDMVNEYLAKSELTATEAAFNHGDIKAQYDAWDYLKVRSQGNLPILMGSNLDTFRLAVSAAKLKGLVLEFGVRHGNSIKQLVQLAQQEVHGFDSFEGLPEDWHGENKEKYSTKGRIPKVPPLVKLHAGWFSETLPAFLKAHPEPVRLVNIDCDIYSSTNEVLNLLAPQIVSGTVIIFDEYIGNEHWREDEFKAFQEAVAQYSWKYEYLSFSFFTKQVVVKII